MQQERHVVALDLQIPLVNVRRKRQRIQIVKRSPVGIVNEAAVFAEAHTLNVFELLTFGKFLERVIDLFSDYKINRLGGLQRLIGL